MGATTTMRTTIQRDDDWPFALPLAAVSLCSLCLCFFLFSALLFVPSSELFCSRLRRFFLFGPGFLSARRPSPTAAMSEMRRAVVKNADMSEEMQQEAVDVATTALSKYGIEKDVAAHIKKVRKDERERKGHAAEGSPLCSCISLI